MNCPKCSSQTLSRAVLHGVEIDRCPECGGAWFDASELSRVVAVSEGGAATRRRPRSPADAQPGDCPRCGKKMLRVKSALNPQVILDSCPDCRGIWLDAGEFEALGGKR